MPLVTPVSQTAVRLGCNNTPSIILQGHRRCILGSAKTIVIGLKKYKKNWVFFSRWSDTYFNILSELHLRGGFEGVCSWLRLKLWLSMHFSLSNLQQTLSSLVSSLGLLAHCLQVQLYHLPPHQMGLFTSFIMFDLDHSWFTWKHWCLHLPLKINTSLS